MSDHEGIVGGLVVRRRVASAEATIAAADRAVTLVASMLMPSERNR